MRGIHHFKVYLHTRGHPAYLHGGTSSSVYLHKGSHLVYLHRECHLVQLHTGLPSLFARGELIQNIFAQRESSSIFAHGGSSRIFAGGDII